jgi:RNA polymerase sigma factor (sigma-70 family)
LLPDGKNVERPHPELDGLDAQFRTPLMRFFLRRIGNRAEAEDLTQEVFARLLKARVSTEMSDVQAYVFQIASNLLRDHHRFVTRGRSEPYPSVDLSMIEEVAQEFADHRNAENTLIHRETLDAVLACLGELGERTRNVFILFRLEGMKHREIATLYGISQSTVEKHVMRAAMHLAQHFRSKD